MLSALLLGLSQPGISLEIPGRPLFEVLAKLETLTNEKLEPAAEIKHLPLILKVTNQPWSHVKKQIAWATWATWIERDGKWILQRTKANHEEFSFRQVRRRMMMMEPFFDGIVKRAEKSGDWQKEATTGLDPLERKYAGRIKSDAWRIIASLGKERFAQNENEIWCYPARTNETPFPTQADRSSRIFLSKPTSQGRREGAP